MKIDSASIGMDSARSYSAASYSYRRFELKDYSSVFSGLNGNAGGDTLQSDNDRTGLGSTEVSETKAVSSGTTFMSLEGISTLQEKMSQVRNNYRVRNEDTQSQENIRQQSVKYILELLFGNARERLKKWLEEHGSPSIGQKTGIGTYNAGEISESQLNTLFADNGSERQTGNLMWYTGQSFSFTHAEYNYESEETSFAARGTVKTADGREISFNIDVSMSREFEAYYEEKTKFSISQIGGAEYASLCDPLVINLDSNIASVSDQKIRFDIDGDGELDTIGQLAQGSGYLALDKNNDGKINDGTELFGTASGDGFADLAKYDNDGNGWIDENDEVWSRLKVMTYDAYGRENLYTLAQTGVGAICLNRVATDFSQKDEDNVTQSVVRSTGIFLYENGHAGTVQHLDVAKYQLEA